MKLHHDTPLFSLFLAAVTVGLFHLCGELAPATAAEAESRIEEILKKPILEDAELPLSEVKKFTEARVPPMPQPETVEQWEKLAESMRQQVLKNVVLRGEAAQWNEAELKIDWQEEVVGGPGYQLRKLRYEAVPGLWIPAVLYIPEKLEGKVPVVMNVNGHDRGGKSADYKQIRCINQAKRGMLALNVEWLGMGQLNTPSFAHYKMNQLDMTGTSGLSPFYLSMKRGLDVLLSLEHADPARVAVAGLSGGGWQTIVISSLDTRVTLSNPVAGYSSFRTRAGFASDLGDSEQTPVDLAVYADYAQLTAMRAPRPTLLTFNAKDNCCFKADHALPPLLDAAEPIYKLYGQSYRLRSHVNEVPGNHNFGQENREALYRFIGDNFFADDKSYNAQEIPSEPELKSKEDLHVALPEDNADFHTLALALSKKLPRVPELPEATKAEAWRAERRIALGKIVRNGEFKVQADATGVGSGKDTVLSWKVKFGSDWTVPAVEIFRGKTIGTTIIIADGGRQTVAAEVEKLLTNGQRVVAIDPFYIGESKISQRDFLFALLVSAVGERPLGIQAAQLMATAKWLHDMYEKPVTIMAVGPRMSLAALVAASLNNTDIAGLELHGSLGSLREIIEQNQGVNESPEFFCFGLLEQFDICQLGALIAPRPCLFMSPTPRVQTELEPLVEHYKALGVDRLPFPPSQSVTK